ncbi:MAG: hydroxymethylbilane synthase [Thermomicrobiales bacterium]|jgi:hydroxymethylbilane synthase|nr:hydroxymethylbilane synthase [Thermomicrobiales bacterium]
MRSRTSIRIGARGSILSRRQAAEVSEGLRAAWPDLVVEVEVISTTGDRVLETPLPLLGGKGAFTEDLEAALLDGRIDLAVHSLKDLPTREISGLIVGALTERASVVDVLISRSGAGLFDLPVGATIGTSSPRRSAQLLRARSDFRSISIRGNVDTRIRKALDPTGEFDAIVLARAGLERLSRLDVVTQELSLDVMLPAPGQGALAIQCRDEPEMKELLAPLHHTETALATLAERSFLAGLGGGCSAPVAAYGRFEDGEFRLDGRVGTTDGSHQVDVKWAGPCPDEAAATEAGLVLAQEAIALGAGEFVGAAP